MTKFLWIVIGALLAIILVQRACNKPSVANPTVKVDGKKYELVKQIHDTTYVPYDTIVYINGKDIYHNIKIYDTIPVNVDTISILKDYFTKNVYIDTLRFKDSIGYVSITDTIFKNTIANRTFKEYIDIKVITNTTIVKDLPKGQVYLGGTVGIEKPNLLLIGPSLLYKTKSDKMHGIGAGFNSNLDLYVQGSIYWKIQLRK